MACLALAATSAAAASMAEPDRCFTSAFPSSGGWFPASGCSSWVIAEAASENPVMAPRATAPSMSITPMSLAAGLACAVAVGEDAGAGSGGDGATGGLPALVVAGMEAASLVEEGATMSRSSTATCDLAGGVYERPPEPRVVAGVRLEVEAAGLGRVEDGKGDREGEGMVPDLGARLWT